MTGPVPLYVKMHENITEVWFGGVQVLLVDIELRKSIIHRCA